MALFYKIKYHLYRALLSLLIISSCTPLRGELPFRTTYLDSRVATLEISIPGETNHRPIPYYIPSQGESIQFDFDLLEDIPLSLCYRLEYYDAHWQPSRKPLLETQQGFSTGELPRPQPSISTKVHYWHYALTLDEESNPHPILSGNWKIYFYEEGKEYTPLLEVSFAILNPSFELEVETSNFTLSGKYDEEQEVSLSISPSSMLNGSLEKGTTVLVLQNGRRDNAVYLTEPSFSSSLSLHYDFEKVALFEGGNEYTSFEILGEAESNMGVEILDASSEISYAKLYPTKNKLVKMYAYREDADGRFVIRAPYGASNPVTDADYYIVEFTFYSPRLDNPLFISGEAFEPYPIEERILKYDESESAYKGRFLLKAGYYSYLYLSGQSESIFPLTSEESVGNHCETTNHYTVLVYYRELGTDYDQLLASQECRISN